MDKAEKDAEALLPLHEAKTTFKCKNGEHTDCAGIVSGESAGSWFMCVCNCHFRVVVAAKLRERDIEIERLKYELAVIGDMAVTDWNDEVVGAVDKALAQPVPATYAEQRRAEFAQVENLRAQLATANSAIDETLRLADSLNDAAENGAGFSPHWGERVMQAVRPLLDVPAFADATLEHNRVLLEANGKNVDELVRLRAQLAAAQTVLNAWHTVFGTTQLTHALARLESAEAKLAAAKADAKTQFVDGLKWVLTLNNDTVPTTIEDAIQARIAELEKENP